MERLCPQSLGCTISVLLFIILDVKYRMRFDEAIKILNDVLSEEDPITFNSSWIMHHAPHCYRFILKNVRTELGHIDWDRITSALEWKFQRRWAPARRPKPRSSYEDPSEVASVLNRYNENLYVFIECLDQDDRRIQDTICILLVRLAQRGNLSAKQEIMKLVRYTIDGWMDHYHCISRWQGYDDEIQRRLETCIRLYRYTGSFLNYVFRNFLYAGRRLQPLFTYSLDEPVFFGSKRNNIESVVQDTETNEIHIYRRSHT